MSNSELDKKLVVYYKQIEQKLVCSAETKRKIVQHLKQDVMDYLDEKPNATIDDDIIQHFGSPDVFAAEYISGFEDDEIDKRISKIKKRRKWFIIALIAVVIIAAIGSTVMILENNRHVVEYYDSIIVE